MLETAAWAATAQLPYTVIFILFDQEENCQLGSESYIESLTEDEKADDAFMLNIDSVATVDCCCIYGGRKYHR